MPWPFAATQLISALPQPSPASATLTFLPVVWTLAEVSAFKPLHILFFLPFLEGHSTSRPTPLSPYWQLQMQQKRILTLTSTPNKPKTTGQQSFKG